MDPEMHQLNMRMPERRLPQGGPEAGHVGIPPVDLMAETERERERERERDRERETERTNRPFGLNLRQYINEYNLDIGRYKFFL